MAPPPDTQVEWWSFAVWPVLLVKVKTPAPAVGGGVSGVVGGYLFFDLLMRANGEVVAAGGLETAGSGVAQYVAVLRSTAAGHRLGSVRLAAVRTLAPVTVTPVSLPAKAILSFSSGRNRPS